MTIEEFIEENREELSSLILNVCPNCELDDEEIEMWVSNDEGLYNWALQEGVEDV